MFEEKKKKVIILKVANAKMDAINNTWKWYNASRSLAKGFSITRIKQVSWPICRLQKFKDSE